MQNKKNINIFHAKYLSDLFHKLNENTGKYNKSLYLTIHAYKTRVKWESGVSTYTRFDPNRLA